MSVGTLYIHTSMPGLLIRQCAFKRKSERKFGSRGLGALRSGILPLAKQQRAIEFHSFLKFHRFNPCTKILHPYFKTATGKLTADEQMQSPVYFMIPTRIIARQMSGSKAALGEH